MGVPEENPHVQISELRLCIPSAAAVFRFWFRAGQGPRTSDTPLGFDGHPRVHRANVLHVAQATYALALCAYPSCLPVSRRAMWSGLFGGAPKTSANAGAPPLGNASSSLALAFSSTLASCYIRHRSPRPKFIWLGLKHMRTQGSRQGDIGTSTW